MEDYMKEAAKAIESDAEFAYDCLKGTADKQQIEFWWAVEVFLRKFNKLVKKDGEQL